MPTAKKKKLVEQFLKQLDKAQTVVFTDYSGLSTPEIEELRAKIKATGGTYTITKNTLLNLALEKIKVLDKALESTLKGPTATLFSREDEIAPIKALDSFRQTHNRPLIKGGLLAGKFIPKAQVIELAQLPSFNELIARLISQINAPLTRLSLQLKAPLEHLAANLRAIEAQKTGQ